MENETVRPQTAVTVADGAGQRGSIDARRDRVLVDEEEVVAVGVSFDESKGTHWIVKPRNTHVSPAVTPKPGSREVMPTINPPSTRTVL